MIKSGLSFSPTFQHFQDSNAMLNQQVTQALGYQAEAADDGTFWMALSDFQSYFSVSLGWGVGVVKGCRG